MAPVAGEPGSYVLVCVYVCVCIVLTSAQSPAVVPSSLVSQVNQQAYVSVSRSSQPYRALRGASLGQHWVRPTQRLR